MGNPHKSGPFCTVKSLRTNPTIVADPSVNPRLAKLLEKVAFRKELIVCLVNSNVKEMLEFCMLREFLQLGYSVLLSDVGIVYLQDPFDHIYRDSDVESMTDGHNNSTTYGFNDVFDETSMGWPVIVHVNYHPDKLPRMKAVVDFYVNGNQDALQAFPDGSE
ncbi:hypothetical protein MKW92_033135 [Papaver armeniacum]|nr:hypothetical protein MKW92_033135 [Papaver armeniacum]